MVTCDSTYIKKPPLSYMKTAASGVGVIRKDWLLYFTPNPLKGAFRAVERPK